MINKNILNCKDIKLQIFAVYQLIYWLVVICLKMVPISIEELLAKRIIVALSGISLALTIFFLATAIISGKTKNNGAFIIFLGGAIVMILNQ